MPENGFRLDGECAVISGRVAFPQPPQCATDGIINRYSRILRQYQSFHSMGVDIDFKFCNFFSSFSTPTASVRLCLPDDMTLWHRCDRYRVG